MAYYNYDRVSDHIGVFEYQQAVNYELPLEINSYKDAADWWRRKTAWRGTEDRPAGRRDHNYRRMRVRSDEAIEFEYNGSVIARWHPDNTLSVSPPASAYAHVQFERSVKPRSIANSYNSQLGRLVLTGPDDIDRTTKIKVQGMHGEGYVSNPEIKVFRLKDEPITLSLQKDEDCGRKVWLPTNIYRCAPFQWLELDKGQLRQASLKYNITAFVDAIQAALAMGADIKTAGTSHRSWVDPTTDKTAAGESILELLEQERFVEAAAMVRVNQTATWDPVAKKYDYDTSGLKTRDVKSIRHQAYKTLGLLYIESQRIITLPQLSNIATKVRDFGKVSL